MMLVGGYLGYQYYSWVFQPNVTLAESSMEFFIESDQDYKSVKAELEELGIIDNAASFEWIANRKKYPDLVKPGRYILFDGMSNNALINLLRSGAQEPVNVIVASVRTKNELASRVSQYLELDSAELIALLNEEGFCRSMDSLQRPFLPYSYQTRMSFIGAQLQKSL